MYSTEQMRIDRFPSDRVHSELKFMGTINRAAVAKRHVGKTRNCRSGFTLVELMVVIVIIGLLSGAVAVSVRSYLIAGKQNVAKMEIAKIRDAVDNYYIAYDRYPTNDEGIEVLAKPSDKFADGLLNKIPYDPWGNPYEYVQPGRNGPYTIICYGADAQEGGDGADQDIASDDLNNDQE